MSLLQALRAQYPQYQDYSDEELTGFLTYQAPSAASPVEAAPADNDAWQITKGFKAGIDQTQALGYGLLGVAGDVAGSEDLRQYGVEGYQRNMQEAQVNGPDVAGFTDIEGVGDALSWAGYTLGNLAPTMATALAGGGIGGLAARKAAQTAASRLMTQEIAKGATRQTAAKTAGEFIAKRIAIGQGLGAYAASTGMETGSIYGETEDAGVSLVHGAVAGAFDALPIARVLGKFGLNRAAKEQVQKSVTAEVLKQGGLEAGTEALQTLVEQHAKYWVDTNGESLLGNLGEANWKEIADASAAGALGGGVMGGAAGLLTRNPMDDAQDKIRSAGEQAAADGGDLLDQEIAKAKTAVTEIPEATIEEEQQKQSRAERMTGIDGMIITAERMGFTDEETLLRRAKMLYSQAEAERAKGNQDMASRFIERGNRLYRDATETQEDLRAESVNFPVPYVSQGDVTGGELVPTSVPNFTMPPEDIAGRATEIPTPQTALPGSTTPQLPPGTGQIDMGRDRPERAFTPVGPVTEGIGRNVVERQAQAAPGLPQGNAARTITPDQYRALRQLRRDGLSTKLRERTPEQVEAIQTVAAVQAGEVNVSASDIEAAAHAAATSPLNALPDPTDAQKAAGNYTKGHFKWAGLDIAIENPQGSKRSGTDDKGRPWENTMGAHYGYVKRTEGNDGDHVDIFIGPNPDSDQVFVIDQRRDKGAAGPFDEHKVMAGFDSQEQAERAYLASYDTGWQLGDVTATTEGDFKQWLKEGDTTKPFADAHTKPGKIDTSPEPVQETAESEQVHLRPNGKPYRTEAGALSSTVYHDNEANAEVVPHGNGFAVRVVARESVTDDQQTASPRTGETQAAETAAGRAKRTVDGQLIYSDGRRWYLQSPENRGSDRVFGDEIYRSEDEATQAARQQAARIDEDRVRRQRLEAEEKADQDAEQAQIDSYQGFLSDAPMKRGHQRATLERIVNHRGKPKTRKQMIEDLLAEGFTLESGQLEKGDSFYNVMTLTKTGLQYAEHLQARESMQEPERQSESPSIQDFIDGKRDDVPSTEEVEAEAKPQPSANTIFTEDAAERARALLKSKLGQLNSGIDPEIMQAGITLAGYHIEKGARTFSAYAKAMVADLGEAVKPYLKSWYMGVKFDPRATGFEGMDDSASVENANIDETVSEQSSLADYLLPRLNQITNNRQLKVAVAEFNSVPVHSVTDAMLKDSQEAMELALVNRAREIVAQGQGDASTFRQLVDLYQKQPNMDVRSSTSMENQAYSTPAPLAFLASRLAGIDGTTTVYEPTAGNGMLLIGADPGKVTANELNDLRAEQLQEQGFKVTQHDATEHTPGTQVDAAIMNPPFGGIAPVKHDGYTIKTIDHLIAAKALAVIKDNGRAVIIIGANKQAGDINPRDRTFFNWLYSHYNVTDHFEVDGYLYKRQGAGWPVRVLVVNGREDSKSISPVSGSIERVNTWDEVYERYTESLDAQRSDRSGAARADATGQSDAEDRSPGAAVSDDQEAGAADQRGTGREPGRGSATGGSAGSRIRRDAAADGRNDDRGGQPVAVDQQGRTEQQPEAAGRAGAVSGTDTGVADRGPSARDRQPRVTQSADGSSFQSSYQTRSGGSNEAVLTPVNMAGATERALRDIEAEVGNIDQYVMDKLGYDSLEDLHKAFMGLQVDTIAAGIHNMERGKGLIIADQCVHGDTRIYNPITGDNTPIRELAQSSNPIPVLSLSKNGFVTRLASAPFFKGRSDIFKVTLASGINIKVTAAHRFLSTQGWISIGDGLSAGHSLAFFAGQQESIWESDPSTHDEDGQHCTGTVPDCLGDCSEDCHPHDGQLLPAVGTDQSSVPLQDDALKHIHPSSYLDDRDTSNICNLLKPEPRRSRNNSSPLESLFPSSMRGQIHAYGELLLEQKLQSDAQYLPHQALRRSRFSQVPPDQYLHSCTASFGSDRAFSCAQQESKLTHQSARQSHDSWRHLQSSYEAHRYQYSSVNSPVIFDDHTGWDTVVSIEYEGFDDFYDMWVPELENYVAEGFVNHNTGVGKGRQAAGLLRYALREGMTPVFVTVKDNLFTDMFNDLADIGTQDVRPFILNQGGVVKQDDAVLLKNPPRARHIGRMADVIATGDLPSDSNMLFLTYSQLNTDNRQRKLVDALKGRALFVLDESHTAAGDQVSIGKGGVKKMTTAGFISHVINERPVAYLSATYAKTPNNMPVYYRTDLMDAVDSTAELVEAVAAGGAPLQTVMSGMLAESGQLFRRERSFDGISVQTVIDTDNTDEHSRFADTVTEGLRAITDADRMFHDHFVPQYAQQAQGIGGDAFGAGNRADSGVDHTNFTSIVHNFISQLLLGMKAKRTAEIAIDLHRQGKKPVIALQNTMGSFLNNYVEERGLQVGDALEADYRDVLMRALDRTRRVSVKAANGDEQSVDIPLSELDPATRALYDQAAMLINDLMIDELPVSPIDFVRNELERAGIKVSEITGRKYRIDYSSGSPVLAKRETVEVKDRRGTVDGFNGGDLDALILNAAGSTGLSIHASEKFTDQKPRHMLVMQAMGDINVLMQMLGRINRTGQVELPGYSMLGLDIPAEKRPLARTANKMKSLNANTSANTDSDTSIDAPDIMNKYGDRVVNVYLRENPDVARLVDMDPSSSKSEDAALPGLATTFTGRMALLPVQQQREIYEEIETSYANLIDYLNKINQNDLVPTTVDLDARILDSKVAYEGKAPETLFGGNTVLHKVDAKYQGKPPTPEDVKAALDKAPDPEATVEKIRQDKAADTAYAESLARRLREAERELRDANKVPEDDNRADKVSAAEDKVQAVEARIQDLDSLKEQNERLLQTFKIGHRARLSLGDETVTGVVMAVKDGHKAGKGNPYSLSKVRVQFMVNSGIRQIDLPFSQLDGDIFLERLRGTGTFGLEDIFAADMAGSDRREVRYVATGNLIAGSAKLPKGRIVTFNDKAGQTHQGILMPRNYDDKQFQSVGTDQKFAMRDSKALVKFLRQNRDMIQNLGVANSNNQIRLLPGNAGMWSIQLPKANKDPVVRSVKFDQPLRDAMGTDFYGKTKYMTAQFPESRLAKVVPVLNDLALMQGLPSYRDAWVKSGGNKAAEATKSFSDPLLSPEGFQRRSDIESDRQRAQQLKAQVDKAYLDGDFDRAEDLDAELETLYQDMEDTLAEMQEDGVSALGDDSGADNSMAQRVRDLASKSGVQEDIEGSPTDIIASRYRELYVEQNMLDDEDRAESLRGAFKDAGDFMGGLRDGIADEALLEAAKDLYESREATRKRQKGTKRSIGINPIGMFFKRPYIVEADETPGLSRAQAQQIADDFLAEYNGHIPLDIRVVEDQTEAYGPAGRVGRIGRIKGAYHPASGAAVLVAGNVSSAKDAQTTLRHEILGHYGLNTFTPEDKRAILDAIKASKASLKDTWSDITKRYGDKTEDVQAEEVFAHIAEETRGSAAQLLDRVMALVRKALRRVGLIKSPLSKSELRALVQTIARQIRDGQRQQQNFPQQDSALFRRDSTGFAIPDETLVTAGIRKIADKFKVLKDLQANIRKSGGQIDEAADAYMTEELFHGKAENDLGQMRETFVEPMAKKMAAFGIKQADLDEYLYAKHAPERNRHIASINPEIPDGGSGMTDAEAAAVIAKVRASGNQTQYDQLAKIVYDMLASKRDILVSAGLEDESVVDAWQAAYRNYVPLKGWAEDEQQDALPRTGKGFSVSGKTKRAMGRTSEAASPSSYAIQDLTETLVKRRKNEVGNAFLKLVETNPNKDYWQVFTDDKPETDRKIIKRADGSEEVVERSVPMAMFQDRYFTTKRDGQTFYIKLEDERLMKAMKNIGPETNNFLIRSLATVNRVLSALNTSYNPEFVVGNFSRDVQTAILNLSAEQSRDDGKIKGERIVKQTVKDIPKAMWAAYRGLRGKAPKNAEWGQWFEEFREQGAKTGYYDMKDIDGQAADIERLVTIAKGGFKGGVLKWAQASRQAIEDINSAVENAVRLSAYVNARKAGISQMRAASLAKNMTVNFNRRGEMGTTLNALYMFANASIQGTMNFARTMIGLKGEKGDPLWSRFNTAQKISVAMMGGAVALAMANRMGAGDDDDGENWYDKVPGYVKERNIVIMKSLLGGEQDGSYWKIPLPYGYNIFHVVGTGVEAATNGDTPVTRVAADITLAALGSFSPIGFQDSQSATGMVLKNVAPTIMKPIVDVAMNENFMGSSIYSENFPFGTKKPDSSLARRSTPAGYQAIAEYLNAVSGGSQWRSGAIDINPDVMRYFVDYTLGGAGKFALTKLPDNAYNLAHGVEQSPNQTIFLSRVAGRVLPYEDQSKFYDRRNEIGQVEAEFKALTGRERAEFFREHRGKLALRGLVKATEKHLKALRKRRDAVYQMNLTPAEQDQRLKEIEQRMKAVVDRFNRAYRERR